MGTPFPQQTGRPVCGKRAQPAPPCTTGRAAMQVTGLALNSPGSTDRRPNCANSMAGSQNMRRAKSTRSSLLPRSKRLATAETTAKFWELLELVTTSNNFCTIVFFTKTSHLCAPQPPKQTLTSVSTRTTNSYSCSGTVQCQQAGTVHRTNLATTLH
jgi:hypothetical protein